MPERFEKIFLLCNSCDNKGELSYDDLKKKFSIHDINLRNFNKCIGRFICLKCKEKNLKIFDANNEVIFDFKSDFICEECGLYIPIPRVETHPSVKICFNCNDNYKTSEKYKGSRKVYEPLGSREDFKYDKRKYKK